MQDICKFSMSQFSLGVEIERGGPDPLTPLSPFMPVFDYSKYLLQ